MDKLKNPHIKISEEKRTISPSNSYCLRGKKKKQKTKKDPAIFFHPLVLANSRFLISALPLLDIQKPVIHYIV